MDRREMLTSAAIGVIGLNLPSDNPLFVRAAVMRADAVSRNGYIITTDSILKALPTLENCRVLLGEKNGVADDGTILEIPEVGRVTHWSFRSGWLIADMTVPPHIAAKLETGELVARPCTKGTYNEVGQKPHRYTLTSMASVYLEKPFMQSWIDGVPACPKCSHGTIPIRWDIAAPFGAEYRCMRCGARHHSRDVM